MRKTDKTRVFGRRAARMAAILGATAMTAPFAAMPALAQSAAEASDANTIIVTAQRRAEALEDVPMSVTLLTADTLQNAGVASVRDLANVTSGYQLGQGGSTPQPSIRGVTTLINGSYENNVAVYIDGLYQATPLAIAIDLPNIQSVQVLKGPQGTLYGRNATGGAILVDTIMPSDRWEGRVEATYARFDDRRVGGYVAGPITEGMGISLAGYTRRTDSYHKKMSRTVPGEYDGKAFPMSQDALRAKLSLELSETFNVEVGYNYTYSSDARGVLFSPTENVEPVFLSPGGNTRPTKLGEAAFDFDPTVDAKQHEFYGKITLDTGLGQLRSITGYTDTDTNTTFDFDGTYVPAFWGTNDLVDKLFQQSLELSIDAIDNVDLIVGAQYFRLKTLAFTSGYFGGPFIRNLNYDPTVESPLSSYSHNNENRYDRVKEAWAVFADVTFSLGDLALTVGGRFSQETQDVEATRWGVGGIASGPIIFSPATGADKSSKYKKFTPRASIRYEVAPNTNVYASYSKGFRAGEWNGTVPNNNPAAWVDVAQESIDAFEIGLKSAGSRLRFDLAGFYYDYTDLQVSSLIVRDGSVTPILQSAPSAEIYGAEANISYKLTDNFNIRAGGTWLHARYGDGFIFTGVGVSNDPNFGTPTCGNGNPAQQGGCGGLGLNTNPDPLKTFQNIGPQQDISGLQMSRAPDFSAYLGADYKVPIGDGGILFAANMKYTDDYVVSNPSVWGQAPGVPAGREREQRFVQGGYVLFNGSITYTDPSDTYYLRVWGNNLTDKRYRLHYNGTSTFGTYSPMAEPRTFGVTVGIKFSDDRSPAMAPPPPPPPPPVATVATQVCPDGTVINADDSCPPPPPPPPPVPERG